MSTSFSTPFSTPFSTRLQEKYNCYKTAFYNRLNLFRTYRLRNEIAPLEDRVEALYLVYEAKNNYAKQYHGLHYNDLRNELSTLQRKLYEKSELYEKEKTSTNWNNMMALGEKVTQKKRELYTITFDDGIH
jgi:hypothetical protein